MKKVLFIAAALFVCTSFSFALDLESESFDVYSLNPLVNSALDYAVMPLADASWSTSDSLNLSNIEDTLTRSTSLSGGSVLYNLITIRENVVSQSDILQAIDDNFTLTVPANEGSLIDTVRDLESLLDTLNRVTVPYGNNKLDLIYSDIGDIEGALSVISSNSLGSNSAFSEFLSVFKLYFTGGSPNTPYPLRVNGQLVNLAGWNDLVGDLYQQFTTDSLAPWSSSDYTLYHYIKNLSDTLASDDDVALAESQKANREEIEDAFLNGSSGSTSLGSSDFGDLSDVGGTVNDTLSLNGQASISSFTSGLSGADQEGQNWFSAATRDSLDSVSGGISTFALDDPYNMEGWEEQYSWVLGGE